MMELNLKDLNNLDIENIGEWPATLCWIVISFVCALILFVGYHLDIKGELKELNSITSQEDNLKQQVNGTAIRLSLERTTQQDLQQMKQMFGRILEKLPKDFQIAQILESISKVGHDNNLQFKLLDPNAEILHEFYAVIPIRIVVLGSYHELGKFVSDLANLQLPLRFTDLTIEATAKKNQNNGVSTRTVPNDFDRLLLTLTAEVYRNKSEVAG